MCYHATEQAGNTAAGADDAGQVGVLQEPHQIQKLKILQAAETQKRLLQKEQDSQVKELWKSTIGNQVPQSCSACTICHYSCHKK
jgi:hypothetical protein